MTGGSAEAEVTALEQQARRVETPCGEANMVWRIWGEGPPLVLGHGAQGAWSHWIRNIPVLAASRTVIAADLPDNGDSAAPSTLDHFGISAALAEGLQTILGEPQAADLVGFSFGGVAFAYLAATWPALVRRLILVGCGGLNTPRGPVELRRVGSLQGEERRAALKSNLLGLMLHYPGSADELAIHLLMRNARRGKLDVPSLVLPDRLLAVLPEVRARVDAIWGELDRPHPHPEVQAKALRSVCPDADFRVVPDAGHWAMYERADAFNAILLEMLDAGPRRT